LLNLICGDFVASIARKGPAGRGTGVLRKHRLGFPGVEDQRENSAQRAALAGAKAPKGGLRRTWVRAGFSERFLKTPVSLPTGY